MQLHYIKNSWSGPHGSDCVILLVHASLDAAEAEAAIIRRTLADDAGRDPLHDCIRVHTTELDGDGDTAPDKVWWLETWAPGGAGHTIYADPLYASLTTARAAARDRGPDCKVVGEKVARGDPTAAHNHTRLAAV